MKEAARKIENENRLLQEENHAMIDEIAQLKDSDYLERLIREQWGYIKEGETLLEMPQPTPDSP
ncbi:MAG: septum formation initiator family protein [Deltaproteobacteria bacterium]|nr:septum formation initiator family protein [Deltaproteobacteria bacterium]